MEGSKCEILELRRRWISNDICPADLSLKGLHQYYECPFTEGAALGRSADRSLFSKILAVLLMTPLDETKQSACPKN
jgi:hypothetical protein